MSCHLDAYIVDAVRTPRGKGNARGGLQTFRPIELVAQLLQALGERCQLDSSRVDDLILGCVTQVGDQGANIAKIAALYAGWSESLPGLTMNRFCCSGVDAVGMASARLASGLAGVMVAGGVESISRVPMLSDQGAWFSDPMVAAKTGFVSMPQAADLLACAEGIGRDELDAYALRSHHRAAQATQQGAFARSMVSVRDSTGSEMLAKDELIRSDMQLPALRALPALLEGAPVNEVIAARYPKLQIEARHSVASAPGLADAASALLLATGSAAADQGWARRARIRAYVTHSVEPVKMLHGNVGAARRALASAGLDAQDIDCFEINESFAAVPLHFQRELGVDESKLNPLGGAIAMGHPLGATGGILLATALDWLEAEDKSLALVSICGGAGLASCLIIERA